MSFSSVVPKGFPHRFVSLTCLYLIAIKVRHMTRTEAIKLKIRLSLNERWHPTLRVRKDKYDDSCDSSKSLDSVSCSSVLFYTNMRVFKPP